MSILRSHMKGVQATRAKIDKAIRVFSIPRSGHHAIIDWIRSHIQGIVYTSNDGVFASQSHAIVTGSSFGDGYLEFPNISSQPMLSSIESFFHENGRVLRHFANALPPSLVVSTQEPSIKKAAAHLENIKQAAGQELANLTLLDDYYPSEASRPINASIINFEGIDPLLYSTIPWDSALVGSQPQSVSDVIIIRDAFNLVASRLAWRGRSGNPARMEMTPQIVEAWKHAAEIALGMLPPPTENSVVILYNKWKSDPSYREQIAKKLGFSEAKDIPVSLPLDGGGSSFDGRNFEGQAHRLDVENRFQRFLSDPKYIDIFRKNPELANYSERLFSINPIQSEIVQGILKRLSA